MKLKKVFSVISYIIEGYITWIKDLVTGMTKQIYKNRMEICNNCEHNVHGICELCGCVLKAKVRVDFMLDKEDKSIDGCPERKW